MLVGGDLNARARLERAARAHGGEVIATTVAGLPDALSGARLVVVDLDAGGREVIDALAAARDAGDMVVPVVGYFSHVDHALGTAARAAGIEALPRGRFWREVDEIVAMEPD